MDPYPPIEPYADGMLDVGDGHRLYWEVSGNRAGKPALVLHGGPGSGSTPRRRRNFDPQRYRIVAFDQRNCGRSTPSAAELDTDLATNTTHHLIADIERLREHLGIERWLVWGGSWGVTLGLAYAQQFPQRVSEMVLVSVTTTRPLDVHWLYHEAGRFFPEAWARFRAGVPESERDGDLVAAYHRILNEQRDPDARARAAKGWCEYEDAINTLQDGWMPDPRYADARFRLVFARLCAHYFSHDAWLDDGELLGNAHRLRGIPAVLIHGRSDFGSPPDVPWLLAQAWPGAELHLIRGGHTGGEGMGEPMRTALDRFART